MMETIDIKNIKMNVNESVNMSHIAFKTKDCATACFIDTHNFEGIAANVDAFPIICHFLDDMLDFYSEPYEDWETWEFEANKYLEGFDMKLGKLHYEPNGRVYDLVDLKAF